MSQVSTSKAVKISNNSPYELSFTKRLAKDLVRNRQLYLMVLPVIAFYIVFHYFPMYGATIAFKDFVPTKGILGSDWIGFAHFQEFFGSYYFLRILKNTLIISVSTLVLGFPAPIILALLINELRSKYYSRLVQTVTYLPHFISLVVICGMIKEFTSDTGFITSIFGAMGFGRETMLNNPKLFVPIYALSEIWKEVGWGSIIYLAALAGVNQELYEAAKIDGAGRWKQTLYVTIPCIVPTIMVLLILRIGGLLNVGFEKIILLYNPAIYDTSDVISSFVYRKGLQEFSFGFSAAVGLFNSAINFILLIGANWLSNKTTESGLW